MTTSVGTADAYRQCEALTRQHAANFFYGICLLPRERRRAMCAVYAFARRVDDIGDGTLEREEKLRRLDAEERALSELMPDDLGAPAAPAAPAAAPAEAALGSDPVMVALAAARTRFSLPPAALRELIEGVRMDVNGVAYERFEDLVPYCRRVAGSIGRLCLAIFGIRHRESAEQADASQLADDLGVAMQLTNILRDLCEDAEHGRVYLPAEDLRRFGLKAVDRHQLRARDGRLGGARRARPLRGAAGARVVSAGNAARGAARSAQWRVCAGDDGHLPGIARPDRIEPGAGAASAHVAANAGEGLGGRAQPARGRHLSARRVVVIGGGLAGIVAALDCAAAGARVTLVEVRPRLGGAAYSFERDGLEIDNGQHVFLRCCGAYRALLERLGSGPRVSVQRRLRIPVLSPGSETVVLRRGSLPAPLHLAGAIARYRHLSLTQRLGAARAALALARIRPGDREQTLEEPTLGEWLARHGQGPDAVSALWDLVARPALNLPAAEASLTLGAFVFRTGLLSAADAGDIGFHVGTLSKTIGEPAERALSRAGVEVRLGWRAERLEKTAAGLELHGRGDRIAGGPGEEGVGQRAGREDRDEEGAEASAERQAKDGLSAEVAIVAVPHARAAALLEPLMPELSRRLILLGSSPIVNLHVVYDRPVCDEPFAAGVGTPVQYLFDRTVAAGAPPGCQYLAVSLSGAEREMRMSVDALRESYLPALRELLPRAREAKVECFLATREHAATFRGAPGVAALRPGPETSVPGLVLAGAWTDTGWPATLEGAVLSGHAAAVRGLRRLGMDPAGPIAPETFMASRMATQAETTTA